MENGLSVVSVSTRSFPPVDITRLEITRKMTECLKHYKLKNPEYIKKIILEEINLLGYVFYKNHVDIDIE